MRREQLGAKVKKLDLNEVLDVAGTPIILVSHLNTLLEIVCPRFNNSLTSLISFISFLQPFYFYMAFTLIFSCLLLLSCFRLITIICPFRELN